MPTAVLEETEEELIEGCRLGQPEAFRALFEMYKDRVYSVALRYSGDVIASPRTSRRKLS